MRFVNNTSRCSRGMLNPLLKEIEGFRCNKDVLVARVELVKLSNMLNSALMTL